jgi:uncharacterized protein (TIGR02001 family)
MSGTEAAKYCPWIILSRYQPRKGNIMQKTKLLIAVLGTLSAMPALAADAPASAFTPSANVAIVSNYLYRGITQTGASPALQGGFDLAHSSGAYVGVWGSSISWVSDGSLGSSAGTEFDTYAGYKGKAGSIDYDVGFLRYNYPGVYPTSFSTGFANPDTNEVYVAATYSIVTAKVSYSLGDTFGIKTDAGSTYFDLSVNYPVGETGYTLGAHYGAQTFKGYDTTAFSVDPKYTDYRVSVSKDLGSGYALGLTLSSTNADDAVWRGVNGSNLGRSASVVSLSRAF